jgi:hypothetical protein
MKRNFYLSGMLSGLLLNMFAVQLQSQSRIWEEEISIPTYQVGDPDPNPRFYDGRVTQGAQGRPVLKVKSL